VPQDRPSLLTKVLTCFHLSFSEFGHNYAILREMTFSELLERIQRPAGYVVGTRAMFWTIERISNFFI
jgi:hypothetical protein